MPPRKNKKQECMMPDCNDMVIYCRGICRKCYQTSARFVRSDQTTWEKLEYVGYAAPLISTPAYRAIMEVKDE